MLNYFVRGITESCQNIGGMTFVTKIITNIRIPLHFASQCRKFLCWSHTKSWRKKKQWQLPIYGKITNSHTFTSPCTEAMLILNLLQYALFIIFTYVFGNVVTNKNKNQSNPIITKEYEPTNNKWHYYGIPAHHLVPFHHLL